MSREIISSIPASLIDLPGQEFKVYLSGAPLVELARLVLDRRLIDTYPFSPAKQAKYRLRTGQLHDRIMQILGEKGIVLDLPDTPAPEPIVKEHAEEAMMDLQSYPSSSLVAGLTLAAIVLPEGERKIPHASSSAHTERYEPVGVSKNHVFISPTGIIRHSDGLTLNVYSLNMVDSGEVIVNKGRLIQMLHGDSVHTTEYKPISFVARGQDGKFHVDLGQIHTWSLTELGEFVLPLVIDPCVMVEFLGLGGALHINRDLLAEVKKIVR
ncbi:hypothetical protein HY408_01810 [Candidatus Gottesmanbacteria bacterium]|nr:hypothetical protein [Candidatus Gottesmanbacteria bacterium]